MWSWLPRSVGWPSSVVGASSARSGTASAGGERHQLVFLDLYGVPRRIKHLSVSVPVVSLEPRASRRAGHPPGGEEGVGRSRDLGSVSRAETGRALVPCRDLVRRVGSWRRDLSEPSYGGGVAVRGSVGGSGWLGHGVREFGDFRIYVFPTPEATPELEVELAIPRSMRIWVYRFVHLFSWLRRAFDVEHYLLRLGGSRGILVIIESFDAAYGEELDFDNRGRVEDLIERARRGRSMAS